jgi:hypothetical protein
MCCCIFFDKFLLKLNDEIFILLQKFFVFFQAIRVFATYL